MDEGRMRREEYIRDERKEIEESDGGEAKGKEEYGGNIIKRLGREGRTE